MKLKLAASLRRATKRKYRAWYQVLSKQVFPDQCVHESVDLARLRLTVCVKCWIVQPTSLLNTPYSTHDEHEVLPKNFVSPLTLSVAHLRSPFLFTGLSPNPPSSHSSSPTRIKQIFYSQSEPTDISGLQADKDSTGQLHSKQQFPIQLTGI